jgi:hypothetical protein
MIYPKQLCKYAKRYGFENTQAIHRGYVKSLKGVFTLQINTSNTSVMSNKYQ